MEIFHVDALRSETELVIYQNWWINQGFQKFELFILVVICKENIHVRLWLSGAADVKHFLYGMIRLNDIIFCQTEYSYKLKKKIILINS